MASLTPDPQLLACVPGLEADAAPLLLQALPGGSVNEVHRVDTALGRFVLRIDGAAWRRPGVLREREIQLHRRAAAAGIAPRIHVWRPELGVLVTGFIDGALWSDADNTQSRALEQLGERLARLHALTPPPVPAFAALELAAGYAQAARARALAPQSESDASMDLLALDRVLAQLDLSLRRLADDGRPACIVHGDLTPGNLLWQPVPGGRRLWLLDWEYAQRADPLLDVACLLAYQPAAWPRRAELLAAANLAAASEASLAAAVHVHEALGWLWHQARGEVQPMPAAPATAPQQR
ncbi:MAG: phosphotransferase [Steroidobacteraceae bacterium]